MNHLIGEQIANEKTDEIEAKPYPFVTDSEIETQEPKIAIDDELVARFDQLLDDFERDKDDEINSPSQYHGQTMDVIDVIDDFLTPKMIEGYLIGNVLKYVLRYQKKGGVQSLKKAQWYLNRTVQDFDLFNEANL